MFIIGFLLGAALSFIFTCIVASIRINEAYKRGYRLGSKRKFKGDDH